MTPLRAGDISFRRTRESAAGALIVLATDLSMLSCVRQEVGQSGHASYQAKQSATVDWPDVQEDLKALVRGSAKTAAACPASSQKGIEYVPKEEPNGGGIFGGILINKKS